MRYLVFLTCYVLAIAAFCNIAFRRSRCSRGITVILLLVPFFLMYVLADGLSMTDTPAYIELFGQVGHSSPDDLRTLDSYIEYGWLLINLILSRISHNPQILFLFTGMLLTVSYGLAIKRYSPIVCLSVLIFLCTIFPQSLYVMRQHSAVAILLLSVPCIIKRKLISFLILAALAASLHLSALVFLPMYWLYEAKIDRSFFVFTAGITAVLFVAAYGLMNILVDRFAFLSHYDTYMNTGDVSNLTSLLIHLCEFVLCMYLLRPIGMLDGGVKIFFIMLCLTIILDVVGTATPMMGRLNIYFSIADIFLLPAACAKIKSADHRILCMCAIGLCFILKAIVSESWTGDSLADFKLII